MINAEEIVAGVIALNGGELVGRTRLQKQVYLLDRCGANFGLQFTYHRYGPFSFELAGGVDRACAERQITVEEKVGRHKVPYAVFRPPDGFEPPARLGDLDSGRARELLKIMEKVSVTVLELAATIVFLRDDWDYYGKDRTDAVDEARMRKPLKATDERMSEALDLLRELKLDQPSSP